MICHDAQYFLRFFFAGARFDDAFDALQLAGQKRPESAEVLYRTGVCSIYRGRWSR